MDGPRLAVVGSVRFANVNAYALALPHLTRAVDTLHPAEIISGDADGMDTFAKAYAELRGIPYRGFPPAHQRWEPDGFKDRNMALAIEATHMLAIRCQASRTYGSGWTADYAERIGRHVQRVTIPR